MFLTVPGKHVPIGLAENLVATGEHDKPPRGNLLRVSPPVNVIRPSLFEIGPAQTCRVGARLLHFRHVWAASVRDSWTVRTVTYGHKWIFRETPRSRFLPTSLPPSGEKRQALFSYIVTSFSRGCRLRTRTRVQPGNLLPSFLGSQVKRNMEASHRSGLHVPFFLRTKKRGE